MADYIDRQAIRDAMYHEAFETDSDMQRWDGGCWIRYKMFENVIDRLPSVDVQPVRHGVWMEENRRPRSAMFYCSECHRTAYDIQPTRDKTWAKRCRYAYCPNCGARMEQAE